MRRHLLITGATGFVGKHLVPKLLARGYRVSCLARGRAKPFGKSVEYIRADLNNPRSLRKKIPTVDAVIHLAGVVAINYSVLHPQEIMRKNVDMLFNLLEALRKKNAQPLVIFTATDRAYGRTKSKVVDERAATFPIEAYTASKLVGELLLQMYQHLYGISYVTLRIDSIYGPHQPEKMFVADVIRKMLAGPVVRAGKLNLHKNFVYVDDVADAIIAACEAPRRARNTVYNIGGEYASLKRIVSIIRSLISKSTGKDIRIAFDPKLVRKTSTEVTAFRLATAKAGRLLGWRRKTTLKAGLQKTFAWHKERFR